MTLERSVRVRQWLNDCLGVSDIWLPAHNEKGLLQTVGFTLPDKWSFTVRSLEAGDGFGFIEGQGQGHGDLGRGIKHDT